MTNKVRKQKSMLANKQLHMNFQEIEEIEENKINKLLFKIHDMIFNSGIKQLIEKLFFSFYEN